MLPSAYWLPIIPRAEKQSILPIYSRSLVMTKFACGLKSSSLAHVQFYAFVNTLDCQECTKWNTASMVWAAGRLYQLEKPSMSLTTKYYHRIFSHTHTDTEAVKGCFVFGRGAGIGGSILTLLVSCHPWGTFPQTGLTPSSLSTPVSPANAPTSFVSNSLIQCCLV